MSVPQTAENLRYLLWKSRIDRSSWTLHLAGWAGCDQRHAEDLLRGAELKMHEQERIAKAADVRDEDLQYTRLVEAENILLENLRYLLDSLEHGQKGMLAKAVGVHYTTISKWYRGEQSPTKEHLDGIRRFVELATDQDIETDALFLSLTPVTDIGRRTWLIRRIDEADPETLKKYFSAFERLLEGS